MLALRHARMVKPSLFVIAALTCSFCMTSPASAQLKTLSSKSQEIVTLANAYIATLSSTQQSATVVANTAANAVKWTNLPAQPSSNGTQSQRNGVAYSTLTTAQKAAWTNLVKFALGDNGYNQEVEVRRADDYLHNYNSGYSGDYQYVGFVGTPSTTGAWMLQIGGHHNAHNFYFVGSKLLATTPYHLGCEPTNFTYNSATYAPLDNQRTAMYSMINALTATQLTSAKLSSSFSDLYLGAGRDARSYFPTGTSNRGILCSALTNDQQTLVKTAINTWVRNSPLATTYQTLYESELGSTYVAYSGTTALTKQGDYVRIDGPHVWIEFVCQNGVVLSAIHYHTIWRDRVTDYGAAYGL